jgi:hypothetical protein
MSPSEPSGEMSRTRVSRWHLQTVDAFGLVSPDMHRDERSASRPPLQAYAQQPELDFYVLVEGLDRRWHGEVNFSETVLD